MTFTPTTAGTANGQTLPYPVEIPTRYFRFRYVNGSTAQGTFALYQTPVSQWSPRTVGLSGSLAPLDVKDPATIVTLPYSDFAASTTYYYFGSGTLTLNARKRVIAWNANDGLTGGVLTLHSTGVYNSMLLNGNPANYIAISEYLPGIVFQSQTSLQLGSHTHPELGEIGDSLFFSIACGSTAPTAGNVVVMKQEEF